MSKHHDLKTDRAVFIEICLGRKSYEVRRNDRDFRAGDTVTLRETQHTGAEMAAGAALIYTGSEFPCRVDHVLTETVYGVQEGYAILSLYAHPTAVAAAKDAEVERLRGALKRARDDLDRFFVQVPNRLGGDIVEATGRITAALASSPDAHPARPQPARRPEALDPAHAGAEGGGAGGGPAAAGEHGPGVGGVRGGEAGGCDAAEGGTEAAEGLRLTCRTYRTRKGEQAEITCLCVDGNCHYATGKIYGGHPYHEVRSGQWHMDGLRRQKWHPNFRGLSHEDDIIAPWSDRRRGAPSPGAAGIEGGAA